ncbi:hypothetical protein DEJ16_02505 [Curtobacterium sp. MCJR17_055]|uniref:DUF6518 family protein n=1 Tax=unclassified Curtobacterium TaxID=257496 RepID=UPI000D8BAA8E|nr:MULTISPECIES: DUF6518 family protein [unclassified Curtobacterium]PYY36771.1 hypothetical protein DEI87_03640 [Curtobacterium sp. MCBD17_029]PYY58117.1 hypothetical protein DEJ26_11195 [Curtobacterium sp. MCPF17_015]PYY58568.1 hypothetical protein DEJ16_02505 [Curtobacterium sp. MCJR17_055]PZE90507.1 hypothetical protein DEI95_12210 [Curtobacterium sp. MCBD17_008]WIB16117.1 DUF6518 family protein [Curtobacterium sp. MCPF17_050]
MNSTLSSPGVARAASPTAPGHPSGSAVPPVARLTMAVTGAVLAGVATSFGQAVPGLASISNAAGPWFVVAVLLVLAAGVARGSVRPRLRTALAMALGVVLLELMHIGYWATTNLRGYPDSLSITNFWVVMALPAGLLAGAVAVALRSPDGRWRGAAAGVTAAVLIGEGARALLQVAATTGTATWVVQIVVGVGVLVAGIALARSPIGRAVALGVGVVGSVGVLAVYSLLGAA